MIETNKTKYNLGQFGSNAGNTIGKFSFINDSSYLLGIEGAPVVENIRRTFERGFEILFPRKKVVEIPGTEDITLTQGVYQNSGYNLGVIDLSKNDCTMYLAPSTSFFKVQKLDEVGEKYAQDLVLNGTFFNVNNDNQPLGVLISGDKYWNPTVKTWDGLPVVSLKRYYFAINKEGKPVIGNSEGKTAEELAKEGFSFLMGGGGPLVKNGAVNVNEQTLIDAHFGPSTHQADVKRPRTAVGIDKNGKLMFVTFGNQSETNSGITLKELAKFMIKNGAVDAMFLDSGSSTGMYVNGQGCKVTGLPQKQPTYIMIKSKKKE